MEGDSGDERILRWEGVKFSEISMEDREVRSLKIKLEGRRYR